MSSHMGEILDIYCKVDICDSFGWRRKSYIYV